MHLVTNGSSRDLSLFREVGQPGLEGGESFPELSYTSAVNEPCIKWCPGVRSCFLTFLIAGE